MNEQRLTVFYDGGCGLCSREIAHYRRLQPRVPITWIDITREPESLRPHDIAVAEAMAEFHVIDPAGRLHKGADGFILLWSALPYYRHWSWLCRRFGIAPLLRRLYARFARRHYRRRCADGACTR